MAKYPIKKLRKPFKKMYPCYIRVLFSDSLGEIKAWEKKLEKSDQLFQIFDDMEDNISMYLKEKREELEEIERMYRGTKKRRRGKK